MHILKDAKDLLSMHGIALKKKDGEHRVNHYRGKEDTAYYTDDLQDALTTGIKMGGYGSGHDMKHHGEGELYPDSPYHHSKDS